MMSLQETEYALLKDHPFTDPIADPSHKHPVSMLVRSFQEQTGSTTIDGEVQLTSRRTSYTIPAANSIRRNSQSTKRPLSEDTRSNCDDKYKRLCTGHVRDAISTENISFDTLRTRAHRSIEDEHPFAWLATSHGGNAFPASQAGKVCTSYSESGLEIIPNYHDELKPLNLQKLTIEHPLSTLPWCRAYTPRTQRDILISSHDYFKRNNKGRARLNPEVTLLDTYGEEYDRSSIVDKESLASLDTLEIYLEVMKYKLNEMEIHFESVDNTNLHLVRSGSAERQSQLLILERLLAR